MVGTLSDIRGANAASFEVQAGKLICNASEVEIVRNSVLQAQSVPIRAASVDRLRT